MSYLKLIGSLLTLALIAVPAYAVSETAGKELPTLTLSDFQRSGDKPVVAWNKFQDYKRRLRQAPQPTLAPSRMVTNETTAPRGMSNWDDSHGTKPVVRFLKQRKS